MNKVSIGEYNTLVNQYNDVYKENKRLKMIIKEYERLNKENDRGFKITNVQEYNIDELLNYKYNWNKLREKITDGIKIYRNRCYDLVYDIEEVPKEQLNDFISYLAFETMQELIKHIQQGSDSNEKI